MPGAGSGTEWAPRGHTGLRGRVWACPSEACRPHSPSTPICHSEARPHHTVCSRCWSQGRGICSRVPGGRTRQPRTTAADGTSARRGPVRSYPPEPFVRPCRGRAFGAGLPRTRSSRPRVDPSALQPAVRGDGQTWPGLRMTTLLRLSPCPALRTDSVIPRPAHTTPSARAVVAGPRNLLSDFWRPDAAARTTAADGTSSDEARFGGITRSLLSSRVVAARSARGCREHVRAGRE